jgi:GTPase SAR1 family protein
MDSAAAQKYKPIKIVVIGDGGVGKTSLIKW